MLHRRLCRRTVCRNNAQRAADHTHPFADPLVTVTGVAHLSAWFCCRCALSNASLDAAVCVTYTASQWLAVCTVIDMFDKCWLNVTVVRLCLFFCAVRNVEVRPGGCCAAVSESIVPQPRCFVCLALLSHTHKHKPTNPHTHTPTHTLTGTGATTARRCLWCTQTGTKPTLTTPHGRPEPVSSATATATKTPKFRLPTAAPCTSARTFTFRFLWVTGRARCGFSVFSRMRGRRARVRVTVCGSWLVAPSSLNSACGPCLTTASWCT